MLEKVRERIQGVPLSCEALKFGAVCAGIVPVPTALLTLIMDMRLALPGSSILGGLALCGHSFLMLLYTLVPFGLALFCISKDTKLAVFAGVIFPAVIGMMRLFYLEFMNAMPALVVAACLLICCVKEYCNDGE